MVGSYLWSRLAAQLRSAVPVVLYLLAVQVLLLGVPVRNGLGVAAGIGMVVVTDDEHADEVVGCLQGMGEQGFRIGRVLAGHDDQPRVSWGGE